MRWSIFNSHLLYYCRVKLFNFSVLLAGEKQFPRSINSKSYTPSACIACWQKKTLSSGFIRRARVAPSLRNFHHIWRKCNILFTCDLPASAPTLLWSLPSWLMVLGEKWAGSWAISISHQWVLTEGEGAAYCGSFKAMHKFAFFYSILTNWACHTVNKPLPPKYNDEHLK